MNPHTTLRMTLLGGTALATVLMVLGGEHGLEARRPPSNVPLRIEFADQGTDRMRGDGGPYEHGIGSVVAYIDRSANAALVFNTDTSGSGGRRLWFDLGSCLLEPNETCQSPFVSGFAAAGILAAPRDGGAAITNGLLGMGLGQTLAAFFQIQINGQPEAWTLCMKPEDSGFCANSPNGVYGRVTRVRLDAWDFHAEAGPDGARSDVADLLSTRGSGKRKVITLEGTYSLPFRFTATCVQASACS
jgi:hypothetical protein